jgi:hypothetical protein
MQRLVMGMPISQCVSINTNGATTTVSVLNNCPNGVRIPQNGSGVIFRGGCIVQGGSASVSFAACFGSIFVPSSAILVIVTLLFLLSLN